MKFSARIWLGFCCFTICLTAALGADRVEKSGRALEAKIKSLLPPGWKVEYDEEGVEVTRLGDIDFFDSPDSQKVSRDHFGFFYAIKPAISLDEYAKIKASNEQYAGFVREIEVKMQAHGLKPGADDIAPRNKEEKELIFSRQMFLSAQLELPVFRYRDISLSLYTEFSKFGVELWRAVVDEKIRRECREVQERVAGLLTRYDGNKAAAK